MGYLVTQSMERKDLFVAVRSESVLYQWIYLRGVVQHKTLRFHQSTAAPMTRAIDLGITAKYSTHVEARHPGTSVDAGPEYWLFHIQLRGTEDRNAYTRMDQWM